MVQCAIEHYYSMYLLWKIRYQFQSKETYADRLFLRTREQPYNARSECKNTSKIETDRLLLFQIKNKVENKFNHVYWCKAGVILKIDFREACLWYKIDRRSRNFSKGFHKIMKAQRKKLRSMGCMLCIHYS